MQKILILLLALSVISIYSRPLDPKKVVVALNCGTSFNAINSQQGFKYQPDSKFVEGQSNEADYNANSEVADADIKFTLQKDLYMFQRHTYDIMTYTLPIKPGFNTIILKFAEKGRRVFDVLIGDQIVLRDFDVYAQVGKFAANDKYIEIEIKKNKCYYKGNLLAGALDSGKIKISFRKGKADNPIIQGIIVYNSPLAETNFEEYQNFKTKWAYQKEMQKAKKDEAEIKELIAVQKKKEKIVIRNDQLEIDDEVQEQKSIEAPKTGFIRSLLMSPLGVISEAVAIGCLIIYVYRNIFLMGRK